jgi:O-antigen ligase
MTRFIGVVLAGAYAGLPLYPAFISLTSVAYPGVSLLSPRAVYAVLAFGCAIAISMLVALLTDRSSKAQPLLVPLLACFLATLLSALVGFDPHAGIVFVCIFASGIVWHCAMVRFFADRGVAPMIFWSYLLSGMLSAAGAIAMVLLRKPAMLYAVSHGRATGTFVLPGELAAYLIVLIPMAYAIARVTRMRLLRVLASLAALVGMIALYQTHSRAGWMGFAASTAFLAAVQTPRRRTGALIAVAVAAAGVAAILLAFNVQHNPSEDYTRVAIWQAALQIIDRFPLTGVGPFDFSRLYAVVHVPDADATAFHAHSLYLTFFAETGVVGVAAFLYACWSFVRVLRVRLTSASADAALLSLAAAAGLVGVAVQGLIDTMSIVIFGLWMPTMGLAIAAADRWDRS